MAARQPRSDEDRALFRSGQLRVAHSRTGDGGNGFYRHHIAARRGMDSAEPDSRLQGTASLDRIRARQSHPPERPGVPRPNGRNTQSSSEGRRVQTQRTQAVIACAKLLAGLSRTEVLTEEWHHEVLEPDRDRRLATIACSFRRLRASAATGTWIGRCW